MKADSLSDKIMPSVRTFNQEVLHASLVIIVTNMNISLGWGLEDSPYPWPVAPPSALKEAGLDEQCKHRSLDGGASDIRGLFWYC